MFCGSMRENLDPFGRSDDVTIWAALEAARLAPFVSGLEGKLDAEVRLFAQVHAVMISTRMTAKIRTAVPRGKAGGGGVDGWQDGRAFPPGLMRTHDGGTAERTVSIYLSVWHKRFVSPCWHTTCWQ